MTIDAPASPDATAPAREHLLLHPLDHAPLPRLDVPGLVALLDDAGLTGRGGAGFPTHRKLAAVASGERTPVVVGNAMEGEFLSHKDAALLRLNPALVLDGLVLLRDVLRADRAVLATGPDVDPAPARALAGTRGVEVRALRGGFVAGQESALVDALDGGPGVPRDPLSPVWRSGVDGRPTLVCNAETLAQLALVARYGARWFRAAGTEQDPGTCLVSVTGSASGLVGAPGVREVARGTRLLDVLAPHDVDLRRTRAVLVGGYHGAWVPVEALRTPLSVEALAAYDAAPGAGVLHVLDRGQCPLAVAASVAGHLARASARQCGPCLNGLPAMAGTLARLASRDASPALLAETRRLQGLVVGRGACAHPDGTARFVGSTLRVFADHVDAHLRGACPR